MLAIMGRFCYGVRRQSAAATALFFPAEPFCPFALSLLFSQV
jgi:hypothetical protein